MKNLLFPVALAFVFAQCSNGAKSPEAATTATADTTKTTVMAPPPAKADTLCFENRFKKDLNSVMLIINGSEVTGEAHFMPYEKDGAHGTIKGTKNGNIIVVDYNYVIEGSDQIEEMMYQLDGDNLARADVPLKEEGTKLVIKDKTSVKYGEKYKKVDCASAFKMEE